MDINPEVEDLEIESCPQCQDKAFFVSEAAYVDAEYCIECDNCGTLLHTTNMKAGVNLRFERLADISSSSEAYDPIDNELKDVLEAVASAANIMNKVYEQLLPSQQNMVDDWKRRFVK